MHWHVSYFKIPDDDVVAGDGDAVAGDGDAVAGDGDGDGDVLAGDGVPPVSIDLHCSRSDRLMTMLAS